MSFIMDETQVTSPADAQQQEEASTITYAGYHSIITGVDRQWEYGGFALPDGSFWRYREPDAAVIVEGQRLRVGLAKINRFKDPGQILDNAQNSVFLNRKICSPDCGE